MRIYQLSLNFSSAKPAALQVCNSSVSRIRAVDDRCILDCIDVFVVQKQCFTERSCLLKFRAVLVRSKRVEMCFVGVLVMVSVAKQLVSQSALVWAAAALLLGL